MKKIEWSNKLSVGIDLIDEQHKKWISHYNEVVEAVKSGKNQEQIVKTLDFITDYTDFHYSQKTRTSHLNDAKSQTLDQGIFAPALPDFGAFKIYFFEGHRRCFSCLQAEYSVGP